MFCESTKIIGSKISLTAPYTHCWRNANRTMELLPVKGGMRDCKDQEGGRG